MIEISDALEAWRRAGMKGWIHELVNGWRDSGQAPFHYSWDEYECVGAYGSVCLVVCVGAHMLLLIMIMSVVSLWVCMWYVCIAVCVCACVVVFSGCVYTVCSGGWAPLHWQPPAAKGLERWHRWNGADLFVSVHARLCYSVVASAVNRMRVVCVASLKGNWIRLQEILAPD